MRDETQRDADVGVREGGKDNGKKRRMEIEREEVGCREGGRGQKHQNGIQ